MKYVLVYWSRYGHNKRLVEYLASLLQQKGAQTEIYTTEKADPSKLPSADVYVFSGPAEKFMVQKNLRTFMKRLTGLEGKRYAIINTHAMKRNWLASMQKILEKKKMKYVAGVDFRLGKVQENDFDFLGDWQQKLMEFAAQV